MSARFRVTVMPASREARTYEVVAEERGDGFEGQARTKAMFAWFHEQDAEGGAPLRGELVEYKVVKV